MDVPPGHQGGGNSLARWIVHSALTLPTRMGRRHFPTARSQGGFPMRKARLLSLAFGTALLFTAVSASAQTPAPPPPAPYGLPITLDQAKKVMAGAEAEAKKNNWPVAIVILDSGGQIVMMQRLDNTQWGSSDIAKEKARSA